MNAAKLSPLKQSNVTSKVRDAERLYALAYTFSWLI